MLPTADPALQSETANAFLVCPPVLLATPVRISVYGLWVAIIFFTKLKGEYDRISSKTRHQSRVSPSPILGRSHVLNSQESQEVVAKQQRARILRSPAQPIQQARSDHTRYEQSKHDSALPAPLGGRHTAHDTYDQLQEAERHVEQDCLTGVEAEALNDERAKGAGDGCAGAVSSAIPQNGCPWRNEGRVRLEGNTYFVQKVMKK